MIGTQGSTSPGGDMDLAKALSFALDNPKQFKERLVALEAVKSKAEKAQADAVQALSDANVAKDAAEKAAGVAASDLSKVESLKISFDAEWAQFAADKKATLANVDAANAALAERERAVARRETLATERELAAGKREQDAASALKSGEQLRDQYADKIAALQAVMK